VLARFQGPDRHFGMEMVREADQDRVHLGVVQGLLQPSGNPADAIGLRQPANPFRVRIHQPSKDNPGIR